MSERIAVVGLGYVGTTVAASLAGHGHRVVGHDRDPGRLAALAAGQPPVAEPGMGAALAAAVAGGRLRVEADLAAAVAGAGLIFLCTGTPPGPGGRPDLGQLLAAVDAVAAAAPAPDAVLVLKSTVPPGTGRLVAGRLEALGAGGLRVAVNPEFLREGQALADFNRPARVVIGADSAAARDRLAALYAPLGVPLVLTDMASAELIKYGANAFLALRVSFINGLADLCAATGGNIDDVARGLGLDPRIGADYLRAGAGYGGSCLPKDLDGLIHALADRGLDPALFAAVRAVNAGRVDRVIAMLEEHLGHLAGAEVAVLGLAFKPGTDDVRDAPSRWLVSRLLARGAALRLHDPQAAGAFQADVPPDPPQVRYAPDAAAALAGADGAVLMTEWPEYAALGPRRIAALMRRPVLVDARNAFALAEVAGSGLIYVSVGRPVVGGGGGGA